MPQRDAEKLISKLRQLSEEGISSFFNEAMTNDRLRQGLGRAGERLMSNKHALDRNIETVLDFVNIPSKKDVRDLKARLDHLSGQILNLNVKLDRILAKEPVTAAPAKPRAKKKI